ncbi:MAG: DUF3047 domain-containing protein [Candidatus Marinimicrobia bacterium]|nr:DUF3047 domain-containing protein [Candidatus Neomarinimicrobiota bacterium]
MKVLFILFYLSSFLFSQTILRDDFEKLNNWKPLTFEKIEKHTQYSIDKGNPHGSYLKAESSGSASGLIWEKSFNVNESPLLRWKWKVSNIYSKGNAKEKSGDDYPVRIYVMFEYDPETAGFWESALYESAKLFYGEYPPHSSLNYIWANKDYEENIIPNPFTDKAQMILLQKGKSNVGKWMIEEVNILEDYKKAFGENPPKKASLAIMSDSDNTGESATAWIDFIEIKK